MIAGQDPNDPTTLAAPVPDYLANLSARLDNLRVGIDHSYNNTGADRETVQMMQAACAVFESLGARIRRVDVPNPDLLITNGLASCAAEAAAAHEATYPSRRGEYGPLAGLLDVGRSTTGIGVIKAQQNRLAFRGSLTALFTDIDVLLTPAQPPANLTIERINQLWGQHARYCLDVAIHRVLQHVGQPHDHVARRIHR